MLGASAARELPEGAEGAGELGATCAPGPPSSQAGTFSTLSRHLKRWRIEDFFRVLKSGCRAEHLAFHTADRLQRAITINAVIA